MANELTQDIYAQIRLEYLYGKDSEGKLWTLNALAKKYNVPVSTLHYKANVVGINGLTWEQKRNIEIQKINNAIENKLALKALNKKVELAKKIETIIDNSVDSLVSAVQGIDPNTGEPTGKKLMLSPKEIETLIKVKANLVGDFDMGANKKVVKLITDKPIDKMSLEELDRLKKAIDVEGEVVE